MALRNSPQDSGRNFRHTLHPEGCYEDFLETALAELQADLYYPIVSKEANEQVYPDCVRTYDTPKEGTITGGTWCLLLVMLSNSKQSSCQSGTFRKSLEIAL